MAMKSTRAPAALAQQFDAALPADLAVGRRLTFGYPSAVVHGHMFAGLHQDHMILRLPDDLLAEFSGREGAVPFEPMPGRPMRGFAVVPPAVLADPVRLRTWTERAFLSAAALPPKQPTSRARAKKSS